MKYLLVLSVLVTSNLISQDAFAVREVVFKSEVKVYARQNEKSEVIGIYNRNDAIPISKEKYGAWRKVVVDQEGKKRIGWIKVAEAKGAKIRVREDGDALDPKNPNAPIYRKKTAVGILSSLSYVYQTGGEAKYTTTNGTFTADYDKATGVNFYFGFFADFNISDRTSLRGYFSLRTMDRTGSAKIKESGLDRDFRLQQEMISIGSTLKWYTNSRSQIWWGPGIEVAKSSDFKFISDKREANDNDISADVSDDPIYVFLSLNAGYDVHLGGNFFLLPEAKFSVIPNGDPLIMNLEVWIPVSYAF